MRSRTALSIAAIAATLLTTAVAAAPAQAATPAPAPAVAAASIFGDGWVRNDSTHSMGIVNKWAPLFASTPTRYDWTLTPHHQTSELIADVDGFYVGTGVYAKIYNCAGPGQFTGCGAGSYWEYFETVTGPQFYHMAPGAVHMRVVQHATNGTW